MEGDVLYKGRKKYNGYASQVYDIEQPEMRHLSYRFRDGLRDGRAEGWDKEQERVYGATFRKGKLVIGSETYTGALPKEEFLGQESSELVNVHFQPSPPSREHWLGRPRRATMSFRIFMAACRRTFRRRWFIFRWFMRLGSRLGLLMGYFGGTFDLIVQRFIEVSVERSVFIRGDDY